MNHAGITLIATYDVRLVVLSVVIAIAASYTALDLAGRVTQAQGRDRQIWLAGGAIAIGAGIWSMHSEAMLAYHLPIPIAYDKQAFQFGKQLYQGIDTSGLTITIGFATLVILALALLAYLVEQRIRAQNAKAGAQLQQALDFEAMLKRITDKVRDSLDESQILQTVVQELCLVLGISCCNTALYNLEIGTSTICYEYATSNPGAQARAVQLRSFAEVYQQLCSGQYFQFCSIVPNPIRGRVAMLACPIFDDQGVLGDLWLINQHDYAFNELEIRLVQQVANQCAIAIRQARLYQAATAQVKELEKLNQLKDDFLSTVSHELRTPVSNMKMAIHMLKIAQTAQAQERYLEILQNECAREIELINNLLDLQRLEAASYSISDEVMILQDWLPTIIESYEVRTQERQQILRFDLPPSLLPIVSDGASLGRILAELLNNACKYTPEAGEIAFRIRQEPHPSAMPPQPTTVTTILTITNRAEIPATELPRIFEKFYRVPNADPWRQGGTGLGLALVQKLVKELKATIKVESSEGWTTFTVQLNTTVAVTKQLNLVKIKGGRLCT